MTQYGWTNRIHQKPRLAQRIQNSCPDTTKLLLEAYGSLIFLLLKPTWHQIQDEALVSFVVQAAEKWEWTSWSNAATSLTKSTLKRILLTSTGTASPNINSPPCWGNSSKTRIQSEVLEEKCPRQVWSLILMNLTTSVTEIPCYPRFKQNTTMKPHWNS